MSSFEEELASKPRKKRSIGYLAQRILAKLPMSTQPDERWEMTVEEIVRKFDATAGSVYEVFHVLEVLLLVTKVGKNSFIWWGYNNFTQTIAFLRLIGLVTNLAGDIKKTQLKEIRDACSAATRLEKVSETTDELMAVDEPLENGDDPIQTHGEDCDDKERMHILTVCQKFIMLFLVADPPKVMSLEFASKVIHGLHLSPGMQKSRARRLYDVSNVLMSLGRPLLKKVNTTKMNSSCRTAFQYCGPIIDNIVVNVEDIMRLPEYRRKYLLFDQGKRILSVPVRPPVIPQLTTVRYRLENGERVVDDSHKFDKARSVIMDLNRPLTAEQITMIEFSTAMTSATRKCDGIFYEPDDEDVTTVEVYLDAQILPSHNSLNDIFD